MSVNNEPQDLSAINDAWEAPVSPEMELDDLGLTEEELDGIKGGPRCHGVSVLAWARVDGVSPSSNHNETMTDDEATTSETLADLLVADEQAEEIKGGPEHRQQLREIILMGITR